MDTSTKQLLHTIIVAVVTTVLVPVVVWLVTSSSERSRIKQEYVRIAVGILQPPKETQAPQKELRRWAVELIQDSAPVKLSAGAVESLIKGDSNLPVVTYPSYTESIDFGSSYYEPIKKGREREAPK